MNEAPTSDRRARLGGEGGRLGELSKKKLLVLGHRVRCAKIVHARVVGEKGATYPVSTRLLCLEVKALGPFQL